MDPEPTRLARAVPVAVDDDGPRPEGVRDMLAKGAKALIVTCRAPTPTGTTSPPRTPVRGRASGRRRPRDQADRVLHRRDIEPLAAVAASATAAAPRRRYG
ncbi:hypothetical protein [Streptomyces sp. NPDC127084]|uniref:hypothetical protein n=1 Tax=Streptomyces sp. NPDC127084 TaxID=3347133 RepID=UPI00364C9034